MNPINEPAFLETITSIKPSPRQVAWQAMEFYGFIHYGINSFSGREWGDGREDISIFNPQQLDTDQWCQSMKAAQMTGVIMTVKHHDGFCLWDTKTTEHSVMHTPYGKDILAQLAASCKKYDLKLGIYLSPWDQFAPTYGQGAPYNDYFKAQLLELLTGYGEVFCLWFDGANGEGPNGKTQYYDWNDFYALIRKHQPNAVISVCGPDVRWCGNEGGHCRVSEYSVVPEEMSDKEKIQSLSQQSDDTAFRERLTSDREDLGSREFLKDRGPYIWYPAEVNTSIRPGWFYHAAEDEKVRPLEALKKIYLGSVGGNATFLLNIPPHFDGYFHSNDVKRLKEMGDWLTETFSQGLIHNGDMLVLNVGNEHSVEIHLDGPISPKYLVMQEDITQGQRIEKFECYLIDNDEPMLVAQGTVVGHKVIKKITEGITGKKFKIVFSQTRSKPILKNIEMY